MHEALFYCAAWSVCCSINIKNPSGLQKKIISVFLGWFLTFFVVLFLKGSRILGWPTSLILRPVSNLNALVWQIIISFFFNYQTSLYNQTQSCCCISESQLSTIIATAVLILKDRIEKLEHPFLSLNESNLWLLEKRNLATFLPEE